jgi:serine/tyrosine/threonine adenylyltransferase
LAQAFYDALHRSGVSYERAFFDLIGGARPERIAASPHRETYEGEAWAAAVAALRAAAPAAVPEHPYFADPAPCTLLIDEVEALWEAIAGDDDWTPLERKIAAIRRAGEAHAGLFGA